MDPVTWATVATVAAGAMSAVGTVYSAQSTSRAAKYNEAVSQQNAVAARDSARVEEQRQRMQSFKQIGSMRANAAASGVSLDSFADVLADSETNAELDALLIRHGGELQARGYENTAALEDYRAKTAKTSGYIGAAGDLLGGAARGYDTYTRLNQT